MSEGIGLWLVGMAETRPSFRENLAGEFGHIERSRRIVLDGNQHG